MFPTICKIGPFTVYSYGFSLAVAAILCFILLSRYAKRQGIGAEIISDLIFWSVIGGILGARLLFVLLNLKFFLNDPVEIIMVHNGGLAWQGSLIGGFIFTVMFVRKKKLGLLRTLDLIAPYIALGQAIGRLGCFLNGCCGGHAAHWGIYFPVHKAYLIPTQLYSFGALFLIFLILKRLQPTTKIEGQVFIAYLFLASIQRFVIQFFRGDYVQIAFGLSFFQIVCICIIVVSILAIFLLSKKK